MRRESATYRQNEGIAAYQQTRLSDRDRDLFLSMLNAPDEPDHALCNAAADYKAGRVEGGLYHWSSND